LKRQLCTPKNSNNSSIPPSQDENRPKRNQSLRQKSGKKTGGQPGHKGSTLKISSSPDQIKKLIPSYCNNCGNDLDDKASRLSSRRQIIELPVIKPITIEYQNYEKRCSCGHLQKGSYPCEVTNHVQYGASVEAIVGYLSVYQYMPFKRMSEMFAQVYNLPLSQGTIGNLLQRMGDKSQSIYDAIQASITHSKVVGGDETGVKVNGDKHWAWIWQNAFVTFITVSTNRGKQTVQRLFSEGFASAILCSDRWETHLVTHAKGHQLCLAHLLRDVNYLIELEGIPWAKQMKALFQKAIKAKNHCPKYDPENPDVLAIEMKLDELIAQQLDKEKVPKSFVFQRSMNKNRKYIFPFLYNTDVPSDNNGSERGIRNLKVKMKVSGQFKSGQHAFAKLRSVIDTCIKRKIPVFNALNQIAQLSLSPE